MAVIRERRNFQIGPIGVARAPQFGRGAGQITAEAITNSANQFADMFYREAAQRAEKAGIEAGRAAEREKVITINPQTGEPEAYEPPSGYGKIAAEAYERVVLRRFEQSIEEEIQNKAKELSVRYEDNANGVTLYSEAMSEYIASMSNVAEGQFKSYIADVGTSYLNATRTNMAVAQVRRERAAAKRAQAAAVKNANNSIEFMIAQQGIEALTGPTETQALIQSANVTVSDGVQAGLIDPTELNALGKDTQLSIARGLLRYAATQTDDPETLTMLQHAVGTQNPNMVPQEFAYVADVMRSFGSDYGSLASLEKFGDGLFADQIKYANTVEALEVERQEAEMALTIFDMENNFTARASQERVMGSEIPNAPNAFASRAITSFRQGTEMARGALAAGNEDLSNAYIQQRDQLLNAQAEGLYLRATSGLSRAEADQLQRGISERDPSLAPETARPALKALMRLESETQAPLLSEFSGFVSSYRDKSGRAVDAEREAVAAAEAAKINLSSLSYATDPVAASSDVIAQINAIENLDPTLKSSMISQAQFNAGKSAMNSFFSAMPSESQIREARVILEGNAPLQGVLSEKQMNQLATAARFANESGKISEMRTAFNAQRDAARDRQNEREAREEELRTLQQINIGQGNPKSKEQRQLLEEDMESRYASALQGRTLASIWTDPSALQDESLQPIFNELASRNVMPESLHNALTGLARGVWIGGNPNTLLGHYTNFKSYSFQGVEMTNPMMDSMSSSERVMLDFLADTIPVFGNQAPEKIAEMFEMKRQYEEDSRLQDKFKAFFDDRGVYDYVSSLSGMENAPPEAMNVMAAAALNLFTTSRSSGLSASEITDRLESQLEKTYPSGGGYVYGPNFSSRVQYPLSKAAPGNEDLLRHHVVRRVSAALPDMAVTFGAGRVRVGARGGLIPDVERVEDYVYLMPLDAGSDGEVRYVVKQRRKPEDGGDAVLYETITDNGQPFRVPIVISNRDPEFIEQVTIRSVTERTGEMLEAKRRMMDQETLGNERPNLPLLQLPF